MNIAHLKYAVEVEKTASITKAAENLFMGQPNLSRGIKKLEETLGVKIFKRTSKGIVPTPQGEEFLGYAKSILAQIEEMESLYKPEKNNKLKFSISVPRASYIADAFSKFVREADMSKEIEFSFKETNACVPFATWYRKTTALPSCGIRRSLRAFLRTCCAIRA